MWSLPLPVQGSCLECGEDLSCTIRIHATREWIARYHHEPRLAEGVNRTIERMVMQRHARSCPGHHARHTPRVPYAAIA